MNHGGKRNGAGRPRTANPREVINFTMSREVIAALRRAIPARGRSMFVEAAIGAALVHDYKTGWREPDLAKTNSQLKMLAAQALK